MSDHTEDDDAFEYRESLSASEARPLLQRFEEAGVRFQIAPEESDDDRLFTRTHFGQRSQVEIYTHQDDAEKVERIWKEFFG